MTTWTVCSLEHSRSKKERLLNSSLQRLDQRTVGLVGDPSLMHQKSVKRVQDCQLALVEETTFSQQPKAELWHTAQAVAQRHAQSLVARIHSLLNSI